MIIDIFISGLYHLENARSIGQKTSLKMLCTGFIWGSAIPVTYFDSNPQRETVGLARALLGYTR